MVAMIGWLLGVPGTADSTDVVRSALFGPQILALSLHLDGDAMASLHAKPDTAVPATLVFKTAVKGEHVYQVTTHIKGQLGSARPFEDKPAFKISFAKGEQFFGREHLTLNNMVQDPTMLHEALGYQVYAAAGVPVPDTGYVMLTVNDRPYGLYLNVETIDQDFLRRRLEMGLGFCTKATTAWTCARVMSQSFSCTRDSIPITRSSRTSFVPSRLQATACSMARPHRWIRRPFSP